ncbi:MAG TPA: LamG domain-containing protein, partial [Candidatus Saccharimonadales bacterium]|nr:LamG domain-containing protein [Candidatus Saccharimonadales bacterium]
PHPPPPPRGGGQDYTTPRTSRRKLVLIALPILLLFLIAGGAYATINLTAQKPAQHTALKPGINLDQGQKGLVGWWKLNGNTKDSTPYQDNGTLSSPPPTPTTDRKGVANGGYSFNSNGAWIDMGNPSALRLSGSLTMSAWIKTLSTASNIQGIMTKYYNVTPGRSYRMGLVSGQLTVSLSDDGNDSFSCHKGPTLIDGQWHLVEGVYNATAHTVSLYADGTLLGTCTGMPSSLYNTSKPFQLGTWDPGLADNAFQGSISDVRLYNRALSQADITNLYNSYNSQVNLYSPPGSGNGVNLTAGLIGYWPFNGNARDATPYQNNGTVSGAALTAGHTGRANSAYQFSDSGYINIGNPAAYANVPRAFTYSLWVKPTGVSTYATPLIMGTNVSHTYFGIRANNYGGNLILEYGKPPYDGSNFSTYILSPLSLNIWTMCTITFDGSTLKVYINGAFAFQLASVTLNPTYGGLIFGHQGGGNQETFVGALDNPRVYNRPLSAAEVQALYDLPD